MIIAVLVFLMQSACTTCVKQPLDPGRMILVLNETINTLAKPSLPGIANDGTRRAQSTSRVSQWYVQVSDDHSVEEIEQRVGVKLGHYVPNNAFVLVGDTTTAATFAGDYGVVWVGRRPARHKVAPQLVAKRDSQMGDRRRSGPKKQHDAKRSLFVLLISKEERTECAETLSLLDDSEGPQCWARNADIPIEARDIVQLWNAMFKALGLEGDAVYVSDGKILVHYTEASFNDMLEWISDRPEVVWVERKPEYMPHNSAATKMLIAGSSAEVRMEQVTENLPIRQRGIDGANQIVGVADTGLDWDSCFFWESANSLDFPQRGLEPPFNFVDQGRRKIISYNWVEECELCDRCPQIIEDDKFQFASSNGLLESGKDWRRLFPEDRTLSSIQPRTYDSSGGAIRYDIEAYTTNVSSQYLAQGAGAFDFPVDIQIFVVSRADLDTFNTNDDNDIATKCLNKCTVKGSHLVVDQENLKASNGGYGVIISNRGKNGATAHIWIKGTVQFMTADKPCGDDGDDKAGHGTHITGSMAGSAFTPETMQEEQRVAKEQDGMAPAAKIFFSDMMQNADPNCNVPGRVCNRVNEVSVPNDLANILFADPYNAGARVHLDAWGCKVLEGDRASSCNEYNTHAQEIDAFMFDKQDFLVITAAGDTGNLEKEATVAAPATCKNCLTVGATNVWNERYREAVLYRDPMQDICGACSFPDHCSESDFIFGQNANESNRESLMEELPTCCDSTVQQSFEVPETLIPPQQTWTLFLPNMSTVNPNIQSFIQENFQWGFRGASIQYEFSSEFSLFGPVSDAAAKPEIQVMVFPRADFEEYFESGVESCLDEGAKAGKCRPNPCVSGTNGDNEVCFSRKAEWGPIDGCPPITYDKLLTDWIDPHCHEGPCTLPDPRGAKGAGKFTEDCPSPPGQCCNDKFLTKYCMNEPCEAVSHELSGIVRHPTDSYIRARNGYGFVVRNLAQNEIKIKGKVSIHRRDYPCRLQDCCATEGAECCSATYTRSFAMGNACGDQCPATFQPGECIAYEEDILALSTSKGPSATKWGNPEENLAKIGVDRYKPDLVAPGVMIASANSDGNPRSLGPPGEFHVQCGLPTERTVDRNKCNSLSSASFRWTTALSARKGSSVSAGLVAGAAALVRQYLVEGWFPFGVRNESNTRFAQPLAALIKAMLINSARSMTQSVDVYEYEFEPPCNPLIADCPVWVPKPPKVRSMPITGVPNNFEGYGRPQLDKVLWFTDSPWSLWVNESVLFEQGHMASFTFDILKASFSEPLKITMAYSDPPGTPGSANLLVNDLDLIVTRSSNQTIRDVNLGKSIIREVFETSRGNSRDGGDFANPQEQVIITNASATQVRVVVYARKLTRSLSTKGQRFAIVVTGQLRPKYHAWAPWRIQILEEFNVGYEGEPNAMDTQATVGFDFMDVFKTGHIRYQDLPLRLSGPEPTLAQAKELIADADDDLNGAIELGEWRLMIKVLRLGSQYIRDPVSYTGIADRSILETTSEFYVGEDRSAACRGGPYGPLALVILAALSWAGGGFVGR